MGAMEKAIKKYCEATNSKMIGCGNGQYCFCDSKGNITCYRQKELLKEVDNLD